MQRREKLRRTAALRVVGVGGGGITAIEQLMKHGIKGIDFIVVDTDAESLHKSQAPIRILIDPKLAAAEGGDLLRVGAPPQPYPIQTAIRNLRSALFGSDMVFIIGGLGGQTAAGAANIVAHIAKEHQAVILGILTLPFRFEGHARAQAAERVLAVPVQAVAATVRVAEWAEGRFRPRRSQSDPLPLPKARVPVREHPIAHPSELVPSAPECR